MGCPFRALRSYRVAFSLTGWTAFEIDGVFNDAGVFATAAKATARFHHDATWGGSFSLRHALLDLFTFALAFKGNLVALRHVIEG